MKLRDPSHFSLILALTAISLSSLTVRADNEGNFFDRNIPDGYRAGRSSAVYGAYNSTVSPKVRGYQEDLLRMQNKAYGLSFLAQSDEIEQAEAIYVLENEIVEFFSEVGDLPDSAISPTDRKLMLSGAVRAYQTVRVQGERLTEDMVRFIDEKIPGPNGPQTREDLADSSIYYANYRREDALSPQERKDLYEKRKDAFIGKGGSLSEIHLLNEPLVSSFGEVTRMEYVWLENGNVNVTSGKAGHVLLAAGQPVKAAGQIVWVKAKNATMVVVSNASGNYKPDLTSAQELGAKLSAQFKVPAPFVIVTSGEPLGTQLTEIYLKGRGTAPLKAKEASERLNLVKENILTPELGSQGCASVFGS